MNLSGRRVVLGVCGGIAAYKSVELCRRLVDAGAFVSPVLTQSATRFVGTATFAALAGDVPRVSLWDSPEPSPHTTLGQAADLIVVAPATARLLASYAHGLSDDLLSATLLASRAPVVVCPAMHTEMWEHPAVQENVEVLRNRGVRLVSPEAGHLAGGDVGMGRLAEVETILTAIDESFSSGHSLVGRKVLVTAGGTREAIDPVRYLGNRSSGKQGLALARRAAGMGAEVTLISTVAVPFANPRIKVVNVESAAQMHDAVMATLEAQDVVIMAAAVADFRPVEVNVHKIKKTSGVPEIVLEPTVDILNAIAQCRRHDQVIVGFAAETEDVARNAAGKLGGKRLDFIVANDVTKLGAGFSCDTNSVIMLGDDGSSYQTDVITKDAVAQAVLNTVVERLITKGAGTNKS